jgi:tetratricopeptide (TPR) repeat protein
MQGDSIEHNSNVKRRAFVAMPFGTRQGRDGFAYDFDAIYSQLIKPTCEMAGFVSFQINEDTTDSDLLTDLFQEFLLADVVICDLTIDDVNTFYKVGILHVLRKKGFIHIQARHVNTSFDIFNLRAFSYHITEAGVPDLDFLENDKLAISRLIQQTWKSTSNDIQSPIFNLLPALKEPNSTDLRIPLAIGYWKEYNDWKEYLAIAKRRKQDDDVIQRVEKISNPLIKETAILDAGKALANIRLNESALVLYRKGRELNPSNLAFRHGEAFHLSKLGRTDEAIVALENILQYHPDEIETIGLLGDVYKAEWIKSWINIKDQNERMRMAFNSYHWLIKSFDTYIKGINIEKFQFRLGITALILGTTLDTLANQFENPKSPDPEIASVRKELPLLKATLEFILNDRSKSQTTDYWKFISKAELLVLTNGSIQYIRRAYRKALTLSRRNLHLLKQSIEQLELLQLLGIRGEFARIGYEVIKQEIERIEKEKPTPTFDT